MPDSQTRSARDAEVAAILYGHPEEVGALVERLCKLIGECCPDARERVHPGWKIVAYSLGKHPTWGMFCYVGPVKGGVNLGFNQGVSLSDPLGLLEGNAKNSRHVKFRKGKSPDWEAVRELIEGAYALAVWKQQPD